MQQFKVKGEYITLGQFLKASNAVSSGIEAKIVIQDELCKVNSEIETRRGKKLYSGDIVEYDGIVYKIV